MRLSALSEGFSETAPGVAEIESECMLRCTATPKGFEARSLAGGPSRFVVRSASSKQGPLVKTRLP